MKTLSRAITSLFPAALILAACNSFTSTPNTNPTDSMQTSTIVSTTLVEPRIATPTIDPRALPTLSFVNTPVHPTPITPTSSPAPVPSSTPLVFTDPSISLSERIVYYYVMWQLENPIPEGIVHAIHLFAPTYADATYTSDTAADLRTALEIILHKDSRRVWDSTNLEVVDVTFRNGHADVVLQGAYRAAGDAQPCAASLQILMTVFANPAVRTAAITLNEDALGGLCIFRDGSPPIIQTVDDVYLRADIETYMQENAYVSP